MFETVAVIWLYATIASFTIGMVIQGYFKLRLALEIRSYSTLDLDELEKMKEVIEGHILYLAKYKGKE